MAAVRQGNNRQSSVRCLKTMFAPKMLENRVECCKERRRVAPECGKQDAGECRWLSQDGCGHFETKCSSFLLRGVHMCCGPSSDSRRSLWSCARS